jgi:hypothetical protein
VEGEQLKQETVEPIGFPRQMDVSRFDFCRLCHYAVGFAAVRFRADRVGHASWRIMEQVLQERHAGAPRFQSVSFGRRAAQPGSELAPQWGTAGARTSLAGQVTASAATMIFLLLLGGSRRMRLPSSGTGRCWYWAEKQI